MTVLSQAIRRDRVGAVSAYPSVRHVQAEPRVVLSIRGHGDDRRPQQLPGRLRLRPRHPGARAPPELEMSLMMASGYSAADTGVLVVDPYNDFLSEGGKLFPRGKSIIESVNLIEHMSAVLYAVVTAAFGSSMFRITDRWRATTRPGGSSPRRNEAFAIPRPSAKGPGAANFDPTWRRVRQIS